jgi:hypothetical protein
LVWRLAFFEELGWTGFAIISGAALLTTAFALAAAMWIVVAAVAIVTSGQRGYQPLLTRTA